MKFLLVLKYRQTELPFKTLCQAPNYWLHRRHCLALMLVRDTWQLPRSIFDKRSLGLGLDLDSLPSTLLWDRQAGITFGHLDNPGNTTSAKTQKDQRRVFQIQKSRQHKKIITGANNTDTLLSLSQHNKCHGSRLSDQAQPARTISWKEPSRDQSLPPEEKGTYAAHRETIPRWSTKKSSNYRAISQRIEAKSCALRVKFSNMLCVKIVVLGGIWRIWCVGIWTHNLSHDRLLLPNSSGITCARTVVSSRMHHNKEW